MVRRLSHLLEPRCFYRTNMQFHTRGLCIFLSRLKTLADTEVLGPNVATWGWETEKLNMYACDFCPQSSSWSRCCHVIPASNDVVRWVRKILLKFPCD